jgi:hypothetical protein
MIWPQMGHGPGPSVNNLSIHDSHLSSQKNDVEAGSLG